MKPKYAGLMTLCLAIAGIGMVAWWGFEHQKNTNHSNGANSVRPLSELQVPSKSVLEQMDRLERQIHLLSSPLPRSKRRADLSALGYYPVIQVGRLGNNSRGAHHVFDHRVTMAFDGQVRRYCIIDSELYSEGAILPDGAVIMKIESQRVLIAKESLQKWLDVDPLIDTAKAEES